MRQEAYRPQFHFSAQRNWINDPNGLIWFEGEYHLFFQYNPFGDQWGHMSWGHAVSKDLVHWRELPVALPETEQVSIFSGSTLVDWHNSSGLGQPGDAHAPLVAAYTGCRRDPAGGQAQELAWSVDRGRSWKSFTGNPVLDIGLLDFRDPKVFWHAGCGHWVMVVVMPDQRKVAFYSSPDLKAWTLQSHFYPGDDQAQAMGIWECPDLLQLPLPEDAGQPGGQTLWVLKVDAFEGHPSQGSGARLYYGEFDGKVFTPRANCPPTWADWGADFYAALSFANLPQGRCIWLAWMNCHRYAKLLPTQPWRGAMTVPRELSLRRSSQDPLAWCLVQQPVPELQSLRGEGIQRPSIAVPSAGLNLLPEGMAGQCLELDLQVASASAGHWGLDLLFAQGAVVRVGYDAATQCLYVDRSRSGFVPQDPHYGQPRRVSVAAPNARAPMRLQLLVDWSSLELFVNGGEITLTEQIHPPLASEIGVGQALLGGPLRVKVFAQGGELQLRDVHLWPLRAARFELALA